MGDVYLSRDRKLDDELTMKSSSTNNRPGQNRREISWFTRSSLGREEIRRELPIFSILMRLIGVFAVSR